VSAEFHSYGSQPTTLEQAQALIAELRQQAQVQIAELQQKLQWSELQRLGLEEQLRLKRIEKYGVGSEKLSNLQLELLEEEPGVSQAEVEAESERPPLKGESSAVLVQRKRKAKKHPGRQNLPPHLPRVERVIACPAEQCQCGVCGQEKAIIGYEISEQLEVEPAKYFVQVTKREKRACRCGRGGVITAPVAKRIIEKGLVSDGVVIQTLVNKYGSHLPLYRQSVTLKQESGLELSRATMDGWVMQVGQLLMPVVGAMKNELLAGSYLQADETPVDVQMHDGRGHNHQAYLWQYSRPWRTVVFDFRLGRGREGPKQFLGKYGGILQTDGYVAYEKVGGPGLVHAGCWTHCRRGFANVAKLNPGDPIATPILEKINALFAIDAAAHEQGLSLEARQALRREKAPEVLGTIKTAVEAARASALPGSTLGKACEYALGQWPKLIRFLDYPELELSTNLAENSIRPIAVGRKNWIHVGSPQAGPRVAAILSIFETCRRIKLPVREYLSAVLAGLANMHLQYLSNLTPTAWAAQHS
jgi:transposase